MFLVALQIEWHVIFHKYTHAMTVEPITLQNRAVTAIVRDVCVSARHKTDWPAICVRLGAAVPVGVLSVQLQIETVCGIHCVTNRITPMIHITNKELVQNFAALSQAGYCMLQYTAMRLLVPQYALFLKATECN